MKFSYQISNVLGAVYKKGDLLFTPDGNIVISPVGNRICLYDLKNNSTVTLPIESWYNYETLAISPSGAALIAINEEGEAHLISLVSRRKVFTYRFNEKVSCVRFSPDGKLFAACKSNKVFIFKAPGQYYGKYNQFVMEKVFSNFYDDTTWLDWSDDSRILAVGSKDGLTKLFSVQFLDKFRWYSLASHSDSIVAAFFEQRSLHMNTISRNGQLCIWECNMNLDELTPCSKPPPVKRRKQRTHKTDDEESEDDIDTTRGEENENAAIEENVNEPDGNEERISYNRLSKHYLNDLNKFERNCKLTCSCYHKETRILVTGFSNGAFFIHELPDVTLIHSLSISDNSVSSMVMNKTGDLIAIGCEGAGQLLVWEWQSETYILKQQAHSSAMSCITYSPDGLYVVTGGEDGKVKVWNTQTGYCFVTFSDHTSAITSVKFANNRKFLVSSSLDGTVRAFDMTRYRNFRTFTTPRAVQFSCVALDYTGEFVAAGGQDVFEIYLWSMKIGRLLECLCGHQGPVVSIAFSPLAQSTTLAFVSWDKTLRIWNAVESGTQHETVELLIEGLAVAYRPDGKEIVVSTLNGHLKFFNAKNVEEGRLIEGLPNLGSGRNAADLITAKQNLKAKAFTSVCYSADGEYVIAGGQSKYVCIYNVAEAILIKKFTITQNRSLDGVDEFINHRKLTEFGNMDLIESRELNEGGNVKIRLPGVKKGDMAARSVKPEIRVYSIAYSPTGLSWSAATTEGVLVYTLDSGYLFDPFQLEIDITPENIKHTLLEQDYAKALMMSIKLNEGKLLQRVLEDIPPSHVELIARSLPKIYSEKLLKYMAVAVEATKHFEFYLIWIQHLLNSNSGVHATILFTLQRNLTKKYTDLSKICDFNKYTSRLLISRYESKKKMQETCNDYVPLDEMFENMDDVKKENDTDADNQDGSEVQNSDSESVNSDNEDIYELNDKSCIMTRHFKDEIEDMDME